MYCLAYARLIQFHLSECYTSSSHQFIAGQCQLLFLIMFRTSGRFMNLLFRKKYVLICRETMHQLTSKINNNGKTKICVPALSDNVLVDKSNIYCRHLALQMFREGSDSDI